VALVWVEDQPEKVESQRALKENQGNQNYDLPATVDLNQYQLVAIY
jgi:hypothetical protein